MLLEGVLLDLETKFWIFLKATLLIFLFHTQKLRSRTRVTRQGASPLDPQKRPNRDSVVPAVH